MASQRLSLFGPEQNEPKKPSGRVLLPRTVKNDVSLAALLETPTIKHVHRNPLEWAGAAGLHVALLAALIIVPLYTTATIHLADYEDVPLVAPPPPPPPPPPPAGRAVAPHIAHPHARMTFSVRRLVAPTAIPKKISEDAEDAAAPDIAALGGVPGGVPGGQIGGVAGGVLGGTGNIAPPPPPPAQRRPASRIVRVGSNLKAPRQTYSVEPQYPPLARQTHISGVVVVDAVIDEHGNVAQAHVVSGNPLLINEALKAVLQWKYEPTTLNGQPISVEFEVQVHFNLGPQG